MGLQWVVEDGGGYGYGCVGGFGFLFLFYFFVWQVVVATLVGMVVAGCGWPIALSFSDDFFYFILIGCLYYFNVLNVKI